VKKLGRYDILRPIALGATTEILLAFDPQIERQVAIKVLDRTVLSADEMTSMIGRFKREAIAAGRLTHPHIVTVHEYGESGPLSYIVMEHARGPTLREFLDGEPRPPLDTVRAIARQLFSGIIYAHEQGVLHRDLKPGNIVLTGNVADLMSIGVKVLDFGIARVGPSLGQTVRGRSLGTPGYMSPEQILGETVDGRSDLYSLAVVVAEMLAGRRLFLGDFAPVVRQITNTDAPLLSAMRTGLPAGLDAVMARALQRAPAKRYASVREFRDAFEAVMTPIAPVRLADASRLAAGMQAAKALPVPPPGPGKPVVLFVDDEERILAALTALFRHKYEVLVCTDGAQALKVIAERQPHVVVSDQRMPQMAGVDFLRQAREIDPSSVRILLTGYSDLAAIVGSINDGEIFRFVNKPWSNPDIRDIVAQAVEISLATRHACAGAIPVQEATEDQRAPEAILVAQKSRELFAIVNDGFGRTRPVCYAADVAAVLRTIEDQEVAMVLCELDEFDGADVMLKLLKQSHPQIQTVAVAATSDSASLISLINQAQILRFMTRPLRLGLLERALRSALAVHANYKARPVLSRRQKVQATPEVAESSIGRQILQRLAFLAKSRIGTS
jgi:eukaryotic-like serine/threonine-protein kinase